MSAGRVAPCASILIVAFVASVAVPARADDARDQSRAQFRRGVTLAEGGDYAHARDAFVEAYRLFPHPSILLNLGIARWRTGEVVQAEQDLAKFLADDGGASPDDVASGRAALAAVRERLGTVRVVVRPQEARAAIDDKAIALVPGAPVDVRAEVGRHRLVVDADGYARDERDVEVTHARTTAIEVTLVARPGEPRAVDPATSAPPEAGPSARATAGWALVGTSVALAGIGTYAGLRALSLASAYDDRSSPSFQDPSTKSTGITLRTLSDVTFASAVVLGGVGAWLVVTTPHDVRASLVVSPSFAGVRGSF